MAYCYQCIGCVTDYDFPPEEKECWCVRKLTEVNYKDESCDRLEYNKELKKINSKDHPEFKFDEKYSKYYKYYFRYTNEPKVIYQLLKCLDSIMIYRIESPKYALPRVFIYNKEFSIPEGLTLEASLDKSEWFGLSEINLD